MCYEAEPHSLPCEHSITGNYRITGDLCQIHVRFVSKKQHQIQIRLTSPSSPISSSSPLAETYATALHSYFPVLRLFSILHLHHPRRHANCLSFSANGSCDHSTCTNNGLFTIGPLRPNLQEINPRLITEWETTAKAGIGLMG